MYLWMTGPGFRFPRGSRRLFLLLYIDLGNVQVAAQLTEGLEIDVAHDVDQGQFLGLRRVLASIDPDLPPESLRTMEDHVANNI